MSLLFKALADDTRLRLAHILFQYELSVNELVHILGIGQSRVSRHLKILAEAGILRSRRDGLWVFYTVPSTGPEKDFLAAIMPFLPQTGQFAHDLELGSQALEERAKRTRQFFNAIADDWDSLNHEILGEFDLPAHVLAAMPRNSGTAVDLGCGTGEVLARILDHSEKIIGVDGSAKMLELCKNRLGATEMENGTVSLRIGELNHLPLADNEADFACLNLVLHHLARPAAIFQEIRRIVQPGGKFFMADFHAHNDEDMRKRYGDHWLGFNCEEIESALIKAGFPSLHTQHAQVGRKLRLFMITAQ